MKYLISKDYPPEDIMTWEIPEEKDIEYYENILTLRKNLPKELIERMELLSNETKWGKVYTFTRLLKDAMRKSHDIEVGGYKSAWYKLSEKKYVEEQKLSEEFLEKYFVPALDAEFNNMPEVWQGRFFSKLSRLRPDIFDRLTHLLGNGFGVEWEDEDELKLSANASKNGFQWYLEEIYIPTIEEAEQKLLEQERQADKDEREPMQKYKKKKTINEENKEKRYTDLIGNVMGNVPKSDEELKDLILEISKLANRLIKNGGYLPKKKYLKELKNKLKSSSRYTKNEIDEILKQILAKNEIDYCSFYFPLTRIENFISLVLHKLKPDELQILRDIFDFDEQFPNGRTFREVWCIDEEHIEKNLPQEYSINLPDKENNNFYERMEKLSNSPELWEENQRNYQISKDSKKLFHALNLVEILNNWREILVESKEKLKKKRGIWRKPNIKIESNENLQTKQEVHGNELKEFKRGELKKLLRDIIKDKPNEFQKGVSVPSKRVQRITRELITRGYDAKEGSIAVVLRNLGYGEEIKRK